MGREYMSSEKTRTQPHTPTTNTPTTNYSKMKKILITLLLIPFALQAQVKVNIDTEKTYQEVEGWGASLIWWAHMTGQWEDEEKIDSIVDLLVSPDHLNMNIFRYNIGGGDDPTHYSTPDKPGHMAKGKGVRAEMEGFLDATDANYNWTRDAGQRKIMMKIKEKRPDVVFEAFSNSPPYWMTHSGCSAGNHDASEDNLKPEYYEAFCDYLIEVCVHYRDEYGIEFKTLEPFNEPQTSYWNYKGSQEGCHFNIETQIEIIKILHQKLKASGLNTVIAASDETNVNSFNKAMTAYIKEGITPMIGQINTHTYQVNHEDRVGALRLSKEIGVDFWQSETGPQGIKGHNYYNNLGLAQRLIDDMNVMRPQAWLDWQYIEEGNNTWCLIRSSFSKETIKIIKNFYVRKQVTKFIKQGYTIIDSDNKNTLAAMCPKTKEIAIVTVNNTKNEQDFSYQISNKMTKGKVRAYHTTEEVNCQEIESIKLKNGGFEKQLKPFSITTFIIAGQ